MEEKWNIGYKKADDVLILITDHSHLNKNGFHSAKPSIPTFHYSSTP
jgi:hypothetical protein